MYVGRFAPSPSGPLHIGSLVTALGSYLRAKSRDGEYIIRIEDIDTVRTSKDYTSIILDELRSLGIVSDREVLVQSQNLEYYTQMLDRLVKSGLTYNCRCTRSSLKTTPCSCRGLDLPDSSECNVCFRAEKLIELSFDDLLQGRCTVPDTFGRVVLRRKDGMFAYNLVVVCDDIAQGITEIVRGADLLEQSVVHIALFRAFGARVPEFMHLPLALNENGDKYSKQNHARAAVKELGPVAAIRLALGFLGQDCSHIRDGEAVCDILKEATSRFDPGAIDPTARQVLY